MAELFFSIPTKNLISGGVKTYTVMWRAHGAGLRRLRLSTRRQTGLAEDVRESADKFATAGAGRNSGLPGECHRVGRRTGAGLVSRAEGALLPKPILHVRQLDSA